MTRFVVRTALPLFFVEQAWKVEEALEVVGNMRQNLLYTRGVLGVCWHGERVTLLHAGLTMLHSQRVFWALPTHEFAIQRN